MSGEQGDVEAIRRGIKWSRDGRDEQREALAALARLAAALERAERDFEIKDRAMTDYFADASRRADEWQARAEKSELALAENVQAWEDMRAYNIRLEERAREAERALAEMRKALGAYRSALRSGEPESDQLRAFGDAALRPSEDTSDES